MMIKYILLIFILSSCAVDLNSKCYINYEFTKVDGGSEKFTAEVGGYPRVLQSFSGGKIVLYIRYSDVTERSLIANEVYQKRFCVKNN